MDVESRVDRLLNDENISVENREHLLNYHDYSLYIKPKKMRVKSVYNTMYVVQKLIEFTKNKDLLDITRKDIDKFTISKRNLSESSINGYLTRLKTFFKVLYTYYDDGDEEIIPSCVSKIKITPSKPKVKEDDLPTLKEVEAILAADTDLRNQTIVALFFDTGSRLGEITNLNRGDVINNNDFVKNGVELFMNARDESTKKMQRKIPLSVSIKYLKHYLNYYDSTYLTNGQNPKEMPLFFSTRGKTKGERLKEETVYDVVKQAAKKAKENARENPDAPQIRQDLNIHPHKFKHTHVTWMLKNPLVSEQILKKRVGWTPNTSMLDHYSHISDDDATIAFYQSQGYEISSDVEYEYDLQGWTCIRCGIENPKSAESCGNCFTPRDADPEDGKKIEHKLMMAEIRDFFTVEKKPYEAHITQIKANLSLQQSLKIMATTAEQMAQIEGFIEEINKDITLTETKLSMLDKRQIREVEKLEKQGSEYKLPDPSEQPDFSKPYESFTPEEVGQSKPKKINIRPYESIPDDESDDLYNVG